MNQCCSADPGTGVDYPICPLGSALGSVAGKPVCVPNGSALNKPSQTEYVHIQDPKTCSGGGGTTTGTCPKGQVLYCYPLAAAKICTCLPNVP